MSYRMIGHFRASAETAFRAATLFSAALLMGASESAAADAAVVANPSAADVEFFEKQVRPILIARCHSCHGEKKQEFGLRLDTRAGLEKGSEGGPAIVAGKPDESPLIEAIRYDGGIKMPPEGKLPPREIAALTEWVKRGAPWPKENTKAEITIEIAARRHWAFQTLTPVTPPDVRDAAWPRNAIDRFVLARLEKAGLKPAGEAERRTLLRRLHFDLRGLPPSPDEIAEFLADHSENAWERQVDRLLASPQYGERWGRYWLDVARYADTKGYVFFEDAKFPWAWTYRDYVVAALNDDVPYDRFLTEQIAADQLSDAPPSTLAALGFLTAGGRFMNNQHDILDDRIDVVGRGVLGLTIGCARCHDHKFDPIPAADYYSLYGIFRSAREPVVPPLLRQPPPTDEYRVFADELWKRTNHLDLFVLQKFDELVEGGRTRAADYLMAAHAVRNQPSTENFMLITDKGDLNPTMIVRWQKFLEETRKSNDPVFAVWHLFAAIDAPAPMGETAAAVSSTGFAEKAAGVVERIAEADGAASSWNRLVRGAFVGHPVPQSMSEVAARYGELLSQVDDEWRAVPAVAEQPGEIAASPLADRLADPAKEELRQVLYGSGGPPNLPRMLGWGFLSLLPDRASQNDFKKLLKEVETWAATGAGAPPRAMALQDEATPYDPKVFLRGNPNRPGVEVPRWAPALLGENRKPFTNGSGRRELADALTASSNPLTARVMANRIWMHHFGVGLVTTPGDFGLRSDPPSHPRLLDWLALELRGSSPSSSPHAWSVKHLHRQILLSATYRQSSRNTDEATVVRSRKDDPENRLLWRMNRRRLEFEALRDALLAVSGQLDVTMGGPSVNAFAGFSPRRAIYGFIDRQDIPAMLRDFDFPDPAASSPQRESTTVPPQALFLMNNSFGIDAARRLSQRRDVVSVSDADARLDRLHEIVYGRLPADRERALAKDFLGSQPDSTSWLRFTQALLMANEFAFID